MPLHYSKRFGFRLFILCLIGIAFASCRSKKIITDAASARKMAISGSWKERYAALLNVSEREIKNEKLYLFIDSWIGVPHRDLGADKRGIDCSAFTCVLQKEVYSRNLPRTSGQMAEVVKRKYIHELEEGDLVFFDFKGKKYSHVGVYLRNNKFVHVSASRGVIVSDLKDSWYYNYFSRAGSIRE